jgi:hypothetical protein
MPCSRHVLTLLGPQQSHKGFGAAWVHFHRAMSSVEQARPIMCKLASATVGLVKEFYYGAIEVCRTLERDHMARALNNQLLGARNCFGKQSR